MVHLKRQTLFSLRMQENFNFLFLQVPSQFVENMLDIHGKYTELIANVFRNDQQFVGALDKVRQYSSEHTGKCICGLAGIYPYCRYFIEWMW